MRSRCSAKYIPDGIITLVLSVRRRVDVIDPEDTPIEFHRKMHGKKINFVLNTRQKKPPSILFSRDVQSFREEKKFNRCLVLGQSSFLKRRKGESAGAH